MRRIALVLFAIATAARAGLVLVKNGAANAVLVLEAPAGSVPDRAARDLQYHLRRASGATVPIVSPAEARGFPAGAVRVAIGAGELARQCGVGALEPEEYVVKTAGGVLVLAGGDTKDSPATLYAVSHLLDRHLGVRWLWPGETGTVVPRRKTVAIPDLNLRTRPDLLQRRLRLPRLEGQPGEELALWAAHHIMGSRSRFQFGHAFLAWYDKYHQNHPDYFGVPPAGQERFFKPYDFLKLCVSNPAVEEQVMAEWRAAGRPANWNVAPNDGSRGSCTCERCRALDGIDQAPEAVWRGEAILTGRYVDFWNRLLRRMRAERPDATLSSYAYSAYRKPPKTKLEDGLVIGFVDTYSEAAREGWNQWRRAGARLLLRPNWFHMGGAAPNIPLHAAGEYFRFARANGMVGFDFDSLMGYWGTQGPYYYLMARLSTRPDFSVDDAIAEYASGFGKAAGAIRRYLGHWEKFTTETAYGLTAAVEGGPGGRYRQVCLKYNIPEGSLSGAWRTLPDLLTGELLEQGRAILKEADAREPDPAVRARVAFFRDGLRHIELTRDVIALAYNPAAPRTELERKRDEVYRLRKELTPRHVVWGDQLNSTLARRGVRPEAGK